MGRETYPINLSIKLNYLCRVCTKPTKIDQESNLASRLRSYKYHNDSYGQSNMWECYSIDLATIKTKTTKKSTRIRYSLRWRYFGHFIERRLIVYESNTVSMQEPHDIENKPRCSPSRYRQPLWLITCSICDKLQPKIFLT